MDHHSTASDRYRSEQAEREIAADLRDERVRCEGINFTWKPQAQPAIIPHNQPTWAEFMAELQLRRENDYS